MSEMFTNILRKGLLVFNTCKHVQFFNVTKPFTLGGNPCLYAVDVRKAQILINNQF